MDLSNRIAAILEPDTSPLDETACAAPNGHPSPANPTPTSSLSPHHPLTPSPTHAPALRPNRTRIHEFLADSKLLDPLLEDYLRADEKLHHLASAHGLTVTDLLAILDHPEVAAMLDALARCAELQAARIAAVARPAAIRKLAAIVDADPEENTLLAPVLRIRSRETVRKSAAHLERISKPAKIPLDPPPATAPRVPRSSGAAPSPTPPPPLHPTAPPDLTTAPETSTPRPANLFAAAVSPRATRPPSPHTPGPGRDAFAASIVKSGGLPCTGRSALSRSSSAPPLSPPTPTGRSPSSIPTPPATPRARPRSAPA